MQNAGSRCAGPGRRLPRAPSVVAADGVCASLMAVGAALADAATTAFPVTTIGGFAGPEGVAVDPSANVAYIANPNADTVSVVALREALGAFATGVTIVTSAGDGGPCGVTANAFSSVSLVPPLVLVCLRSASSAASTIACNRAFAINVLSADQETLARRFAWSARPRGRKSLSDVPHRTEATGAPILTGVACWLDCAVATMPVAGDHVLVIGQIVAFASDHTREPLVFHAGRYRVVRDHKVSGATANGFPLPLEAGKEVNP